MFGDAQKVREKFIWHEKIASKLKKCPKYGRLRYPLTPCKKFARGLLTTFGTLQKGCPNCTQRGNLCAIPLKKVKFKVKNQEAINRYKNNYYCFSPDSPCIYYPSFALFYPFTFRLPGLFPFHCSLLVVPFSYLFPLSSVPVPPPPPPGGGRVQGFFQE